MRILEISYLWPPPFGGAQNFKRELAIRFAARGHEVFSVVSDPNVSEITEHLEKGVTVYKIPRLAKHHGAVLPDPAKFMGQIKKLCDSNTVIHLHLPYHFGDIMVTKAAKKTKTPIVLTYHNDCLSDTRMLRLIGKYYDKLILPKVLDYASYITAGSLDYAQTSHNISKYRKKTVYVPVGMDTKHFSPKKKKKTRYKKIMFLGTVNISNWYKKGLDFLLEGFAELRKEVPSKLIMVGEVEPNMKSQLNSKIGELKIKNDVQVMGRQPYAKLPYFYSDADVFVFTSQTRAEATPIPFLEAMSCGTNVVSPSLVGLMDNCEHMGFYFIPNNMTSFISAVRRSLDNPHSRRELRRFVLREGYDIRDVVKKLEKLFKGLV